MKQPVRQKLLFIAAPIILAACGNSSPDNASATTESNPIHSQAPSAEASPIKGRVTLGDIDTPLFQAICIRKPIIQSAIGGSDYETGILKIRVEYDGSTTTVHALDWTVEHEGGQTIWYAEDLEHNDIMDPMLRVSGTAEATLMKLHEDGNYYTDETAEKPSPQKISAELVCRDPR